MKRREVRMHKTGKIGICLCLAAALAACAITPDTEEERNEMRTEEEKNEQKDGNEMEQTQGKNPDALHILSANEDYTVYEMKFERDGMEIYGELYFPNGQEQSPLVIIGHGFADSYRGTTQDAVRFAEAGIAAYVFDFCGGSPACRSDGETTAMSVLTERDDMETVLDGMKQCSFVTTDAIFLMGESQGGFVAAMLAAKREADVRGLILFYPALVIPDDARELFSDYAEIPPVTELFGVTVGRVYYADVLEMDAFREIEGYGKDVLIVHGDRDGIVPISYAEKAAETYSSAELLTIVGGGHGFYGSQLTEACDAAIRYVQTQVDGPIA